MHEPMDSSGELMKDRRYAAGLREQPDVAYLDQSKGTQRLLGEYRDARTRDQPRCKSQCQERLVAILMKDLMTIGWNGQALRNEQSPIARIKSNLKVDAAYNVLLG